MHTGHLGRPTIAQQKFRNIPRSEHRFKMFCCDPNFRNSDIIRNDYFDLIVCNGVFGWGINNKEDTEVAIKQCYSCLRPAGMLVLGWNDVSTYRPYFAIGKCENLSKFQPYIFPPLSTAKYLTENSPTQHTYNFYLKPSV